MKRIYFIITYCLLANKFCFGQDIWTRKADVGGLNRINAVGFSIGTKGYIGTGEDTSLSARNDFWEYDPSLDAWTQKANFIGSSRIHAIGFSIGTKGYIGTGVWSACQSDFYEWDQSSNIWSQKSNFPGSSRGDAVGFSIGTKGYIATGENCLSPPNFAFYNDLWEWNQSTDTWAQKTNFGGSKRWSAIGFSIGTKGYIGTGYDGSYYNDFWEWDQATNVWTQKASLTGSRSFACGFSIGAKGYIGTGYNGSSNLDDFWEWDQATNTWTPRANFGGIARNGAIGFSIADKGYIGTGQDSSYAYYKDFWEWDPNGVGVDEIDLKKLITVFPNPTTGKINLQYESTLQINKIEVYSLNGEKINSFSSPHFDISEQPAGIYFLNIKTDKGSVVKKIVKE